MTYDEARRDRYMRAKVSSINAAERQRGLDYIRSQEPERLRAHELEMLRNRGDIELGVAREKRMGMENQGLGVGRLKYGYWENGEFHDGSDRLVAEEQGRAAVTQEEKKWAGQREIAELDAQTKEHAIEAQKAQADLEWGKGGGRERVAEIEGKSKVGAAEAQARAAADLQAQKNALEEQRRVAAAEKEKGRLKLQYDKLEQKDRASVDAAANSLAREKGISFEDARAQVMASREQAQQNAAPQEGATKTLSSGRKVVFRNGKWDYTD